MTDDNKTQSGGSEAGNVRRVRYMDNTGQKQDMYKSITVLPEGPSTRWSSSQWLYVRDMLHASDSHPVRIGRPEHEGVNE